MSVRNVGVGEPPQRLLLAMEQLLSSERSVAEFRDELLNTLYAEPASAPAMRGLIEEYARRGLIPQPIERLLLSDIDKVVDEEMPTTPTELTLTADLPLSDDEADDNFEDTHGGRRGGPPPTAADGGADEPAAPASARLEIGEMLRGRFEICGRAPGGSMGVVYKAIDRRLAEVGDAQAYVAIKVLAPQLAGNATAIRALQQEAARGRYLHHPNVVQFLDFDRDGDLVFLVMEWLDGRSLATVLNDRPGQPVEAGFSHKVIAAVGEALEYAHSLGVTHADVKPGNVMIQPSGVIKLLDFGIARVRGRLAGAAEADLAALLKAATPAYASPQVLAGEAARPQDDIYSLGCLAYRLFSGHRVFGAKTALEAQEEGRRPKRIESLTRRQWRALDRALAFRGSERPSGVRAFLDGFAERSPGAIAGGFWRRNRALVATVAMIAVLFAATMWLAAPAPPDRPTISALPTAGAASARPPAPQADDDDDELDDEPAVSESSNEDTSADGGSSDAESGADRADDGLSAAPASDPETAITVDRQRTTTLSSAPGAGAMRGQRLELREDSGPHTVNVILAAESARPGSLRLERRVPGEALATILPAQYEIIGGDPPVVEPGGRRVAFTVENLPDDLIEPDVSFRLVLRDDSTGDELADLTVVLEDDDRRRFAAAIPEDTAAFAVGAITVSESDGAVRVPIWRLNPGAGVAYANLLVTAETALPGEDFLADTADLVRLEPGASDALVYVPIVNDDIPEPAESFSIEIADTVVLEGLYHRLRVTIVDDAL